MIAAILTFLLMGILAVAVVGVALAVIGTAISLAFGIAMFLLFKVLPLAIVGYVVMRVIAPKQNRQLSDADRKWLES